MSVKYLCISIRFLDRIAAFHGSGDNGKPEWPPSPLRLFQAMVASSAASGSRDEVAEPCRPALEWLQQQEAPLIITPGHRVGCPVRAAVPNNDLDIPAHAWSQGKPGKDPAKLKALKSVRPIGLIESQESSDTLFYLYPLASEACPYLETLTATARSMTHLGWGTDVIVGDVCIVESKEVSTLSGIRWHPVATQTGTNLRAPIVGTLDALNQRHHAFLDRLQSTNVDLSLRRSAFRVVGYQRDTDPPMRSSAAFAFLKPDGSGYQAYTPTRRTASVAGMLRHQTARSASEAGRDQEWIDTFVYGHGAGSQGQAQSLQRFSYVPIPTIQERRQNHGPTRNVVGSIRRALVVGPPGPSEDHIPWARRALSGRELVPRDGDHSTPSALLSLIPNSDRRLRHYLEAAAVWATVSPMILPGHDDRKATKAERLIRKSIVQAGYSEELAENALLEWRRVSYWPGLDHCSGYQPPSHLKKAPRYHVRLDWRDTSGRPILLPGPICVGAGRFCGFGLFAALS